MLNAEQMRALPLCFTTIADSRAAERGDATACRWF